MAQTSEVGQPPAVQLRVERPEDRSSVYFFRHYTDGTTLVYVGKAEKKDPLANRIATWYGDFISGKVGDLFREDGTVFRPGGLDHFFQSLQDDFKETLRHAKAEALRTRFIYAPDKMSSNWPWLSRRSSPA